jgi:hypothetical protein
LLPCDVRDEVFLHALREAMLHYPQIPSFLHAGLRQLDLSLYGREFSQSFADLLMPKLDKINTGEMDDWGKKREEKRREEKRREEKRDNRTNRRVD